MASEEATTTTTTAATAAANGQPPVVVVTESPAASAPKEDRRMSDEWDAAKVPPSRFQKRKGSIYATASSRDGHIDRNYQEKYYAKIAEMPKSRYLPY